MARCLSLLGLSFAALAFASPTLHKRAYGVTTDVSLANGQTFDYIVVGAGLAGTTVAARLAENPDVTVLLVEAGGDDRDNPLIYDIYDFGLAYGTPLSWNWNTDQGRQIQGCGFRAGSVKADMILNILFRLFVEARHSEAARLSMALRIRGERRRSTMRSRAF